MTALIAAALLLAGLLFLVHIVSGLVVAITALVCGVLLLVNVPWPRIGRRT